MARNLTRNTRVFISNQGILANCTNANTWELKVLDGYDFSQSTSTEDISVSEAGATPIRGQKTYNVAQEPANISLTTYIRPYVNTNTPALVDAPEKILWASLAGRLITPDATAGSEGDISGAVTGNAVNQQGTGTGMVVDFEESDSNELAKLYVWFHLENTTYRVDNVNISSAEIDFDITAIAQITWSGMGTNVTEVPTEHTAIAAWVGGTDYIAVPATSADTFLRNKLSTMTLQNTVTLDSYTIAITGGSLTVENNMEFLTPEELAVVNQPLSGFAGARTITGNVTAYLNTGAGGSAALLADLLADIDSVSNSFDFTLSIGGGSATKRVDLNMPTAQIAVPTISVEDVISTDISLAGQGSAGAIENQDELIVTYHSA